MTSQQNGELPWIVVGVAVVVLAAVVIAEWTAPRILAPPAEPDRPSSVDLDDARIIEVASAFDCPCGGCGPMGLDACTCAMPRGAVEVKSFIARELELGASPAEVIGRTAAVYGSRKPETGDRFRAGARGPSPR